MADKTGLYTPSKIDEKLRAVTRLAEEAGLPFSRTDKQLLGVIKKNIIWLEKYQPDLKQNYSLSPDFNPARWFEANYTQPLGPVSEKSPEHKNGHCHIPIVVIGWEAEFTERGQNGARNPKIKNFFSQFAHHNPKIMKEHIDGETTDEPQKCVYEMVAHPLEILDALSLRYQFRKEAKENHIDLTRFSEHVHFSVQDCRGPLFEDLNDSFRTHVSESVLRMMSETIPLLATRAQIEGKESTMIKHVGISTTGKSSIDKTYFMRSSQDNEGTLHYEARRIMPGDDARADRPFDPYLAALAVITSGIRMGLSDTGKNRHPLVHETEYIGVKSYEQYVRDMVHSDTAREFFPDSLLGSLASNLGVNVARPAARSQTGSSGAALQ